jgi:hypothetical protein
MTYQFNHLDHTEIGSLDDVLRILTVHKCEQAFIKKLAKNNNDKQQVYIHKSVGVFNSTFDLEFEERGLSASETKRTSNSSKKIPSAVFKSFNWVSLDGSLHPAAECKAILYAQYPETRLSGFRTVTKEMPRSMSAEYTKTSELLNRYLVLGATREGNAIAVMVVGPDTAFEEGYQQLLPLKNTVVIRRIELDRDLTPSQELEEMLTNRVVNRSFSGKRLQPNGKEKPFNGTQVCGYTLESTLGIASNSDKNGDYRGIELKATTRKKVTLMTTEPVYTRDFGPFVQKFGKSGDGGNTYRMNGLLRAWKRNDKTGLTLKILCSKIISSKLICAGKEYIYDEVLTKSKKLNAENLAMEEAGITDKKQAKGVGLLVWTYNSNHYYRYNPNEPVDKQADNLRVVLATDDGEEQAVWSLERLLNNWGKKHNEAVYVQATKNPETANDLLTQGFKSIVRFLPTVLWCQQTTVNHLFRAIDSGIIFLDPGHKFVPGNLSENSRRSQWRVNHIFRDSSLLYQEVTIKELG